MQKNVIINHFTKLLESYRNVMTHNKPIYLSQSIQAWGSDAFTEVFKQEVSQLGATQLPLQQGMSYGNYASDDNLAVVVLTVSDEGSSIHAKTGILFTGIIGGCHCADDPSPNNEHPEYCEVMIEINKANALTSIRLLKND